MSAFVEYEFEVCFVCLYLIAYGEYNDGENTAEEKWKAWEESGNADFVQYMSPACICEEDCGGFTHSRCDLCGVTGFEPHKAVALVPVVSVLIENAYGCGRESGGEHKVLAPPVGADEDVMAGWWESIVQPLTGDGHSCGSTEHAVYEASITNAPARPELVGLTWSAEG